ncbi:MAG: serine hydrolase [Planctomycetes bacterium]|nr:serine hydrolase [Planctomycetota bacterium]
MKKITKLFLLALSTAIPCFAQEGSTLEQRLAYLVEKLEAKQLEYHIPGMALAVVLDDKVVLEHSFGVSNMEEELAVTPDTLFAIGSVTKSFTSTAIGVLVDEGKMDFDAPITKYLPWFDLPIDSDGGEEVLLRDLLSHQTGFTRMHFIAMNNSLSPKEALRAAVQAEPWEEFRSAFLYNNMQYVASGFAAGEVADSDWSTVIEGRVFTPIGMEHSYTAVGQVPTDQIVSTGYQWDIETADYKTYPLRTIDNIGPAGSILSTAGDMARYIRFHLGQGQIDGKRVLSETQHGELWKQRIEIAPSMGYGFGWMLHSDDGVVEHGGNVRGGCAQVAMFPDENLGFVLLMNVSASVLQPESISIVREAMLGDITPNTGNEIDFTPYIGQYIGNFGPFKNDIFTVQEKDGALALDVPGQMLYELKSPDEEGKWYFALTNQIAVSFDTGDKDLVTGLKMHQSGMTFELPRQGVELQPDIPLSELQRYLGTYRNEDQDVSPTIIIQNNRLAVDVPEQMVFELYPPNEDGEWVCRLTDKIKIRFIEDEEGLVNEFDFFEGEDSILFDRISPPKANDPVTAKSILANFGFESRGESLAALGSVAFTGKSHLKQSGLHGTTEVLADASGRLKSELELGKYGWFRIYVLGDEGMMDIAFIETQELGSVEIKNIQQSSPLAWAGNWPDDYDSITFAAEEVFEDKAVWTLRAQNGADPTKAIAIDKKTGDVLVVKSKNYIPELGTSLPYTLIYRNYKEFDGVRLPMEITEKNEMTGKSVSAYDSVESGIEATDEQFRIVAREQLQPWISGN